MKQGEIDYWSNLTEAERHHARHKPFSDPMCGGYLIELGYMMEILPPAAGKRLIDFGCGTGWTSRFFAERGFDVVGVDICEGMIDAAKEEQLERRRTQFALGGQLSFQTLDYEDTAAFETNLEATGSGSRFDVAIFFDCLHHCENEAAALATAYAVLKPGGICVLHEPGVGHAENSKATVERFGVNEKDMPPSLIWRHAKNAGFSKVYVVPSMQTVKELLFLSFDFSAASSENVCGPLPTLIEKNIPGLYDFPSRGITILWK